MKRSLCVKILLALLLAAFMTTPVFANAPASAEVGNGELSPMGWLALVCTLAFPIECGIAVTCFCEWLVSLPFGFDHRNDRLIVFANIVSQLLMWLVYILVNRFWEPDYGWLTAILEILIYSGEFLFYRCKMHGVSWKKCLIYTVAANTASLLLGLLILR